MKKITLGLVYGGIVGTSVALIALESIIGFIPYAYAEDVEDLKQIVITNTKTSNTIAINMKIERLERKADKLERKEVLTPEETDILKDYIDEIEDLEDDLEK